MDEKTLSDGKKTFINGLYRYKKQELSLIATSKELNKIMYGFHAKGILDNLPIHDITTLVKNKYTFLVSGILKKDFDLMLFKDYDKLDFYPANFFVGMILEHYVIMMEELQDYFIKFLEALEKFDKRLVVVSKKRLRVLKSILEGKLFYEFDECAMSCYNEIIELYRAIQDKTNDFYKESPIEDYPSVVEYRLKRSVEKADGNKDKLTESFAMCYDIDLDFLRFIGASKQIPKIKELYLKYMGFLELDTSGIIENPNERYFVSTQSNIFDPSPYLRMSAIELSQVALELELQTVRTILPEESYESLKDIFESTGLLGNQEDNGENITGPQVGNIKK